MHICVDTRFRQLSQAIRMEFISKLWTPKLVYLYIKCLHFTYDPSYCYSLHLTSVVSGSV